MKVRRRMDTPESRKYWSDLERLDKEAKSMNEYLFGTQRKVYCRKCGKKLIDKEVITGYNEFDGTPTKLIIERVCPNQEDHDKDW